MIKSVKSDAVGYEGIQLKFIKIVLLFFVASIIHIFNHVLITNVCPSNWKVANVIPVEQKRSALNEEDYRPVSILSAHSLKRSKSLHESRNQNSSLLTIC